MRTDWQERSRVDEKWGLNDNQRRRVAEKWATHWQAKVESWWEMSNWLTSKRRELMRNALLTDKQRSRVDEKWATHWARHNLLGLGLRGGRRRRGGGERGGRRNSSSNYSFPIWRNYCEELSERITGRT